MSMDTIVSVVKQAIIAQEMKVEKNARNRQPVQQIVTMSAIVYVMPGFTNPTTPLESVQCATVAIGTQTLRVHIVQEV